MTATFSRRATVRFTELVGFEPDCAAGLRHLTTVGGSGLVGVYNSAEAGHDDDPACAWSTVCEAHGFIIGHQTLALALWHAPDVRTWCDACAGEREVKCRECGTGNLIAGETVPSEYRCSRCTAWLYDDDDPAAT